MLLTQHAHGRLLLRSVLMPEEVLAIIKADAAVSLGVSGECEFLLFWSPYDGKYKIALTDTDRTVVISIWNVGFHLPEGVQRPSWKLRRKAYRLCRKFAFTQVRLEPKPQSREAAPPKEPSPMYYDLRVDVTEAGTTIFSTIVGEATYANGHNSGECFALCKHRLYEFASLVEANKDKVKGIIRYHIHLDPKHPVQAHKHYVVSHARVLESMRADDKQATQ